MAAQNPNSAAYGFPAPQGTDYIRDGDDAITNLGNEVADILANHETRLAGIDTSGSGITYITTATYTVAAPGDYVASVATTVTIGAGGSTKSLAEGQAISVVLIGSTLYASDPVTLYPGGDVPDEPPVDPEPVPVTASVPVADDTANTWTWTPVAAGVEYDADGVTVDGSVGTYSVGDVSKLSTITATAKTGYYLTAPVSETFQFTGSVAPYSTTVLADNPDDLFMFDDAAATTVPANTGTSGDPLVLTAAGRADGLAFGVPGIGAGATALSFLGLSNDTGSGANNANFSRLIGDDRVVEQVASFTVAAVVRIPATAGVSTTASIWREGSNDYNYGTLATQRGFSASVSFGYALNDLVNTGRFQNSAPMNAIYHVALVYDHAAGKARRYLNGVLEVEVDVTRTAAQGVVEFFAVGARYDGVFGGGKFDIGGLAVWRSTALPAARVLAHAQAAGVA